MKTFIIALLASLMVVSCDRPSDLSPAQEMTPRGGESGTTEIPPPEPPTPDESCKCNPEKEDGSCPLGTDCVPFGDQDDLDNYFCLAKCTGVSEIGGGYVTTCTNSDGSTAFCKYAEGHGPDGYCPQCLGCEQRPLTLFCE